MTKIKDVEHYTIPFAHDFAGSIPFLADFAVTTVLDLINALLLLPQDAAVGVDPYGSGISATHYKPDIEVR